MRMGLYLLGDSENLLGLNRLSKQKIRLGMEAYVLKKGNNEEYGFFLTHAPRVLCAMADQNHANTLMNGHLTYLFASLLQVLFDAPSRPTESHNQ